MSRRDVPPVAVNPFQPELHPARNRETGSQGRDVKPERIIPCAERDLVQEVHVFLQYGLGIPYRHTCQHYPHPVGGGLHCLGIETDEAVVGPEVEITVR